MPDTSDTRSSDPCCRDPAVDEVVVLDNLSRGEFSILTASRATKPARFVEADILDARSLERAVEGVDAVVHLAATVQLPTQDSEAHAFDQNNNWGSAQVASVIEAMPTVTTIVYMSSVTVYGPSERTIDVETTPRPNTFYGVTKLRGEAHFRRLAGPGRRVHVVRAGNVYGVNGATRFDTVVNRFLLDGRFKAMLRVIGDGEQTRSFITVDRLASSVAGLLQCSLPLRHVQLRRSHAIGDGHRRDRPVTGLGDPASPRRPGHEDAGRPGGAVG